MAWIIGIICIIIVVIFWRIFLPLGVVAAVGIGLIVLGAQYGQEKKKEKKEAEKAALKQKISDARANATSEGKEWRVSYRQDPASGKQVVRSCYISSNDGLCTLKVQKRLNGNELTGLYCPDFKISEYKDIEVKFDNIATSNKMDLESYSNSDDVYIPSSQSSYSGYLSYEKFISRLKDGTAVAIKIPSAGGVWMTFSLKNSSEALDELGKEKETTKKPH